MNNQLFGISSVDSSTTRNQQEQTAPFKKEAAETIGAVVDRDGGWRGEGVCGHRPGAGKAAWAGGRSRLAGQAYQSGQSRSGQLVLYRIGVHDTGTRD